MNAIEATWQTTAYCGTCGKVQPIRRVREVIENGIQDRARHVWVPSGGWTVKTVLTCGHEPKITTSYANLQAITRRVAARKPSSPSSGRGAD
jgi:hypothetical protein